MSEATATRPKFRGMQSIQIRTACNRVVRSSAKLIQTLRALRAELEAIEWREHGADGESHEVYAMELERCVRAIGEEEDLQQFIATWRKEMCGS